MAELGNQGTRIFYRQEADILYPHGNTCRDGSCDWCLIYYFGVEDVLKEYMELKEDTRAEIGNQARRGQK